MGQRWGYWCFYYPGLKPLLQVVSTAADRHFSTLCSSLMPPFVPTFGRQVITHGFLMNPLRLAGKKYPFPNQSLWASAGDIGVSITWG